MSLFTKWFWEERSRHVRSSRLVMGEVDVNQILAELEPDIRAGAGERVVFVMALQLGLPPVWADPSALRGVIMRLVENACEAMPAGGWLRIATRPCESRAGEPSVAVAVTDSGGGLPEEVRGRLFEPFMTTKEGRTGLGLACAYGIARQHGGTLEVENCPGAGATFILTLPQAPGPIALTGRPKA
jgi:signal transduction histidine kinase